MAKSRKGGSFLFSTWFFIKNNDWLCRSDNNWFEKKFAADHTHFFLKGLLQRSFCKGKTYSGLLLCLGKDEDLSFKGSKMFSNGAEL